MIKSSLNKAASSAGIMWRMRLCSAIRAAMACAIVGGAILYGPSFITDQIKFPAFSYVTAILIIFDSTLGDALRGCWHAFSATAQVVPLAVLGRWLVAPGGGGGLPIGVVAVVTAVASFLIVLPESTHFRAKRIALGQIVLVCADAAIRRDNSSSGIMHPLHVAASTALGALACLLALLLPFPGLAYYKVQKLSGLYADNVSARMNIYLKAFKEHDYKTKTELILQAKPLAETGNKLLNIIKTLQEGIQWERPWSRHELCHEERLKSIELPMKGIEYSLVSSISASPFQTPDQEKISYTLQRVSPQLHQKIEQAKQFSPFFSTKPLESSELPSLPLESTSPLHKYEWACFFFSCIDMLLKNTQHNLEAPQKKPTLKTRISNLIRTKNLESALKWSLSLGLATLFGLMLEKSNGCWASLTITISYISGRQAIFTMANTRAQGTAVGSVYGLICLFVLHYLELRILAILPWVIFTSFLVHSKMYGQTGAISAAIGALLILGRKNYGPEDEFAIARLTSVFVGLSCFLLVEILMCQNRAATLARKHMFLALRSVHDFMKTGFHNGLGKQAVSKFQEMREKQREIESSVCELRKMVFDADSEPGFWYSPFRTSCYEKVVISLSNVANISSIMIYNFEMLSKELPDNCTIRKQFQEKLSSEMENFQENVSSLLNNFEGSLIKSQGDSQVHTEEDLRDVEMGKLQNEGISVNALIKEDEEGWRINAEKGAGCVGAIRFCITSLRKEMEEVDICVKEIVRWENHSSQ